MNDKNQRPDDLEDGVPGGNIDFSEVRKVIAIFEEKNLSALEIEVEGFKIKVSRSAAAPAPAPLSVREAAAPGPSAAGEASPPLRPRPPNPTRRSN